MEYLSQYGQDKWIIEEVFPGKKNGYFVDLAAGDGVFLSNTYVLEKELGWKGICIEPNTTSFEKLKENRDCICDSNIIMQDGFEVEFVEYKMITDFEHLLSNVAGTQHSHYPVDKVYKKTAIGLNTLLNNYKAPEVIDYISLDIEGSEIYVLQDFFESNIRKVLSWSIEHSNEELVMQWMLGKGYEFVRKQGHDNFFILK